MAYTGLTYGEVAGMLSLRTLPYMRAAQIARGAPTAAELLAESVLFGGLMELASYPKHEVLQAMVELGIGHNNGGRG
ncbi:MAG: hypothetical protein LBO78_04160 [Rickettsiales bacterium]|jgi:hypothetical protein|nr:hypothetical protein [Rickettsiales bacterium]